METHAGNGRSSGWRRWTSAQAAGWRGRRDASPSGSRRSGFTRASVEPSGASALKLRRHVPLFLLILSLARFAHAQDPGAAQSAPASPPETSVPAQTPTVSATTQPNSFEISGTVRSGKTPLPGVTVTAANTLTGKKFSVATSSNGTYSFTGLPRGRYVVRVEFMGFAPQTQEIILKPETPTGKFDAELILASRQQEQSRPRALSPRSPEDADSKVYPSKIRSRRSPAERLGSPGGAQGGGAGTGDISSLPMNGAGADSRYRIRQHHGRARAHTRFWRRQRRRFAGPHPGISRTRPTRRPDPRRPRRRTGRWRRRWRARRFWWRRTDRHSLASRSEHQPTARHGLFFQRQRGPRRQVLSRSPASKRRRPATMPRSSAPSSAVP